MISFALAGNWDGPCLQRTLWLLQTTTWFGPGALEKHRRHQFVQPVTDVNGLLTACKHSLKIYPVSKQKASSLLNGLATLYPNWSRLIVFSGPKRHQFMYWASAVLGQGDWNMSGLSVRFTCLSDSPMYGTLRYNRLVIWTFSWKVKAKKLKLKSKKTKLKISKMTQNAREYTYKISLQ